MLKYKNVNEVNVLFTYKLTSVQNIEMLQFSPKYFPSPVRGRFRAFSSFNTHTIYFNPKIILWKNYIFVP